jgi:hypothetical protein
MHHTIRSIAVLAIICGQSAISDAQAPKPGSKPAPAAQTAPGAVRPGPASGDQRMAVSSGFTVDYPKKDWDVLVGVGSSFVVLFHRSKQAALAIERTSVPVPLAVNEINDQTANLEVEDWQKRRPLATGFSHQFVDFLGQRSILIDFTQVGALGPEHVRLYILPRGTESYKVICTTAQATFDKYKETCHRIALSVTPAGPQ